MTTEPARAPAAVGVNVTLMLQVPEAATDAPQVFVSAKSPVVATLAIEIADDVPLVSVMPCAALVEPRPCEANVRLAGDRVTAAPPPPPPPPPLLLPLDELPPPHACSSKSS